MKFGGTSVGVPAHFRVLLSQVRQRAGADPLVVVSALSGVTNQLVELCARPELRAEALERIVSRHRYFAREVGISPDLLDSTLDRLSADVAAAPATPLRHEWRDRLLAHGERLAANLVAAGLCAAGTEARAWDAGDAGLVTDE